MADGLKLGLYGLHRGGSADPDTLVRRARLAEEAGFESLWVGDHIALPSVWPTRRSSRAWKPSSPWPTWRR
jgi:alkanesulfonate monooxygenase SsuD/methylene tetrahydromethanopterin reductase-like flavin-dependent oxidoreductase (luciferase family)